MTLSWSGRGSGTKTAETAKTTTTTSANENNNEKKIPSEETYHLHDSPFLTTMPPRETEICEGGLPPSNEA